MEMLASRLLYLFYGDFLIHTNLYCHYHPSFYHWCATKLCPLVALVLIEGAKEVPD